MTNITITRTNKSVSATFLPYSAYKRANELATELKGEIGKTDKGFFMATFNSVKTAQKFVDTWTAEYEANRKVEVAPVKAPKSTPKVQKSSTSKPTTTKGKAKASASSTKKSAPRKAKGNSVDFTQFKGTKSEKNRALHAMLVGNGMGDSRAKEYQAIWNARPWAK